MASLLKAVLAIIPLLNFFVKWLERRRIEKANDLKHEAAAAKEEARVATKAAEVYAERRSDSAAAARLRDGTF